MLKAIHFFFVFCAFIICSTSFSQDFEAFRIQYEKAIEDEDTCKMLIEQFKIKEKKNELKSVELAYLGALETIWANHVINPFSKLKAFRDGKEKIEKAATQTPKNIEISYLRLSVQKNAPSFLGYNDNINEDTEFLKEHRHQIKSVVLQKNVEALLGE